MTLVAADVLAPAGEIDGALFYPALSSGDLTTRLTAYLTQGYARATELAVDSTVQDWYARVYVYYRGWSDVVNRLTLTPASTSLAGEVSASFLQTQINQWILARDAWKSQLDQLTPIDPSSTAQRPSGVRAIPNEYRF